MPLLLLSRQCRALRATRSAALHLRPGAPCILPLRARFHQTAPLGGEQAAQRSLRSAAIIPKSLAVTPQSIIEHIDPLPNDGLQPGHEPTVLFFVTPQFAPWLIDDRQFLRGAVRQAFGSFLNLRNRVTVQALVAVVDKIPTPSPISDVRLLRQEALARIRSPPVLDTGHEGLAYSFLRPDDRLESSVRTHRDQEASFSFVIAESDTQLNPADGQWQDVLEIALANTVFQTGTVSTMFLSKWEKKNGDADFNFCERTDLSHQTLRIVQPRTPKSPSALAVPLIPLTLPRPVQASLGNIVRRLVGADGKLVTASQELESVVPQYLNSRQEASQTVSVWALVIPKKLAGDVLAETKALLATAEEEAASSSTTDVWEILWNRKQPLWNAMVPSAMKHGAHLHRVLSGGGGWGVKAGLLALDPSFTDDEMHRYGGANARQSLEDVVETPNTLKDRMPANLHTTTPDGDFIQFFISPSTGPTGAANQSEELGYLARADTFWTYELGRVPSTADALEAESWQKDTGSSQDVFVFNRFFGALTEGHIKLKRERIANEPQATILDGSKVDVPYTRYCSARAEEEKEQNGKVADDSSRARYRSKSARNVAYLAERPNFDKQSSEVLNTKKSREPRTTIGEPKAKSVEARLWTRDETEGSKSGKKKRRNKREEKRKVNEAVSGWLNSPQE